VENYFNYFTEIEEHFHRRRGTTLLLSTLDWALIESWKDAGIPLEAVLRGIDITFDNWERRPSKSRKVNGLAFCAQEVLVAAEDIKEAGVGATRNETPKSGLAGEEISAFMAANATRLNDAIQGTGRQSKALPAASVQVISDAAIALGELLAAVENRQNSWHAEEVELRLTIIEEKISAVLLASTPDEVIVSMRAEAERELAPYRRKMLAMQIDQLMKQYIHKRLLEQYGIPRLSLFYM
jgi:hypothetical protein